jgi:uncharacterized protein
MPDITPHLSAAAQRIDAYGNGGFRVRDQQLTGPLCVLPGSTQPWNVANPEQLGEVDFAPILQSEEPVELVLVGTGGRAVMLQPSLRLSLKQHGLAVEVMDTGAACRTYNVLLAEGRRVAALLWPV